MKIIKIIKNPYANKDLALFYTNNCIDDTDCQYKTLISGLDVLKANCYENERFKQYWNFYYVEVDSNTTAYKRENGWYDLMNLMNNS